MTKEELGTLILNSERQLYSTAKTILINDQDCADAIQDTKVVNIQTRRVKKWTGARVAAAIAVCVLATSTIVFELSRKDFIDIVKAIISYVFRKTRSLQYRNGN